MCKAGAMALIRFYKKYIRILLPFSCRYYPTCSDYALSALAQFNFAKAIYLIIRRILRCNPLFPGGYDPVSFHASPGQKLSI